MKKKGILFLLIFMSLLSTVFVSCINEKIQPVVVPVDTTHVVSFSTDIYPIFTKYNCTACHPSAAGLDFTKTSSEVVSELLSTGAVVANESANSKFYSYFEGGASHNGKILEPEEYSYIKQWIDNGANDN